MKRNLFALMLGIGSWLTVLTGVAPSALATLGEPAASVAEDQKVLSAVQLSTESRNGYSVQVVSSAALTLREYISPDGIVFAVAWNGLIHPDLKSLLGSYAADYEAARQKTSRVPGRRQSRVAATKVVVETWGMMRNLQGRAYVPALIPPGVNLDEIR